MTEEGGQREEGGGGRSDRGSRTEGGGHTEGGGRREGEGGKEEEVANTNDSWQGSETPSYKNDSFSSFLNRSSCQYSPCLLTAGTLGCTASHS